MKSGLAREGLAVVLAASMVFAATPTTASAQSIVTNGSATGLTVPNAFLFEPEVPFTSLKNVPTWNELEQMLDNPYAMAFDPGTVGNDQGFPSYRTRITRRPGFGVTLPQFLVHPLNYNTTTGEEMRLINPLFPQTNFNVVNELVFSSPNPAPNGTYSWTYENVPISAGSTRAAPEPGEASAIDYNNPIGPDPQFCAVSVELIPPEGALLCGGDPGEPRYSGFSIFNSLGYSTPAIRNVTSPSTPISSLGSGNHRLFDPARGFIDPRNPGNGSGGLNKPSLRIPANGGSPNQPNYLLNTDPAATTHSTENDYIRNRTVAAALGKALFWDMQVGSDSVQSCGTCHFNGTGTDTRTRNQVNPNHLSNDTTFTLKQPNEVLTVADFPLHKLKDPEIAGDPACGTPLEADVSAIPYAVATVLPGGPYLPSQAFSNNVNALGKVTVCDASNVISDTNDVVSSMGVHWGKFKDITLGVIADPSGVSAAKPDRRAVVADCGGQQACLDLLNDPIPGFAGVSGTGETGILNQFRRVEPRNTPTMQAAGFNFDNFWDGRARHDFNGGSVFGAADPQAHVFVHSAGNLVATRQVIRFVSIASLATGPGLSEFEMSYAGRNWAKVGKKLLQAAVTPLANQLVAPTDSLLGLYSNQGGASTACTSLVAADRSASWSGTNVPNKPGLCISYQGLIRQAYYPALWQNTGKHLDGCYTDGLTTLHPNQCGLGIYPAANVSVLNADGTVSGHNNDPFDGYVLSIGDRAADPTNTNQFTQMEGNFSLFWGLSVQTWVNLLVPDNTPFDQFLDANPNAFLALGEPGERGLVGDQLTCGEPGYDPNNCFTPVGNFKRDNNGLKALQNPTGEGGAGGVLVTARGTRNPSSNDPDPLLGLDIFFASNLSLKNPDFRTGRCGECHAIPTLTDHTMPFTSKINLMDAVAEFQTPGVELIVEPLARLRVISGFLLEAEINENGQDAVERRIVNQSIVPNPADGFAYPGATADGLPDFGPWTGADSAFLDNGMYNLGIRPISEDKGRGGNDAFGWPLSIATLMMKNLEGPAFNPGGDLEQPPETEGLPSTFPQPEAPGNTMNNFDPDAECFGLFEPTAQDPRINPGCEGEPAEPALAADAPWLAPFVNNITVGDFPPEMDEAGGAIGGMVNTLTDLAMIEGFMDSLGPFNPANIAAEVLNFGGFSDRPGDISAQMGTWPNVNRVGRMGAFKAAPLRNVELTGPYFHNGGKLTLRQVVDFYSRGGDFPITNAAHRDFNLVNQRLEIQSNISEVEETALVDFLLELTDERNRFARAPFDHPQVIVPNDGTAPENTAGRAALLATGLFLDVKAVGAAGRPGLVPGDSLNTGPEPTFLNVTKVRVSGAGAEPGSPACDYAGGVVSHYCH